jgi:uncharacterized membrane protein YeiH
MPQTQIAEWLVQNGNIALEILGSLAFGLSGLLEAARKKFDIVGMVMVAALAAFGGGTLRDILLDRRPLFWVQNEIAIWVTLIGCVLILTFVRRAHLELTERAMQWPDALGLGVFAAGGTQIALNSGAPMLIAAVMGVITAVFGGVLRDVVVNEIPRAFNDHQPYAVLAFAGGWVVVGLNVLGFEDWSAVAIGAAVVIILRVLSMLRGWRLPVWKA